MSRLCASCRSQNGVCHSSTLADCSRVTSKPEVNCCYQAITLKLQILSIPFDLNNLSAIER